MAEIANLVEETLNNACEAAAVFTQFNQEQVDRIVRAVLEAGLANRVRLAKMAAEETALGRREDKGGKEPGRHPLPLRGHQTPENGGRDLQ
ncbi:MAG: hypothetical protein WC708_16555 [Lentisphaeria bacterium]